MRKSEAALQRSGADKPPRALVLRHVMPDHSNDALLDLVEAGHRESRFGDIPFSRVKAQRQLDAALADRRRHLLVVADVGDRPEGFVFATVGEHLVGTGALIVTINAVYTSQSIRASLLGGKAAIGLLRSVGAWAKGIGAREVLLHATSGIDGERVGRGMERLGFEVVGESYVTRKTMPTVKERQ